MILTATRTVLNSDSVPQSINLEGSDIKFANTVRNLGVCLDPTLSFQQQISSVCRICYLELRRISAIRHYLSEDVTKKKEEKRRRKKVCAFVLSRLDYCNSLLAGCPKYLLYKKSKKYRTMLQDSFSEQPDLPTSLLCFSLFTSYLFSRGSNTNCLCFKIISHQAPIYLSELHLSTPSRQLRSSMQTPECLEYHPSEQSPAVSALSLTRLQLPGTNSPFLSVILPLSALLNLP